MKSRGVPVVMYHSVVPRRNLWARISDPLEEFEKVLVYLSENGFTTILLEDLHRWMTGRGSLPEKPIALTFDDGYLDNWLHVLPLLRRYGHRATVFPSLEFIGEGPPRSTGDFSDPGEAVRYLNWSELREMQNSGFFDVQSHTMTHSWDFCSHEMVDLLVPGPGYNWMAWNADKTVKPLWQPGRTEPSLRAGHPVFSFDRSLGIRRFIPDGEFVERVIEDVERGGGASLLASAGNREKLIRSYDAVAEEPRGRMETDEEFRGRVDYELGSSREELERRLGKPVKFLCWPGGAMHPALKDRWRSYGYLSASLPQGRGPRKGNMPGDSPECFVRIPSGLGEWRLKGRPVGRMGADYFVALLDDYRGEKGSLARMRRIKLKLLMERVLRP
jgi:hypothetical protein